MSADREGLVFRAESLLRATGEAIAWVNEARADSGRLNNDADGLISRLRQARNKARRLSAAARLPMSVGLFGPSQAGKSYVAEILGRADSGRLETVLDSDRLDFLHDLNPQGGSEATALVTRFTRAAEEEVPGYSVRLMLLSEGDIIKLLGNSRLSDFDDQKMPLVIDAARIHKETLAPLKKNRQINYTGGLDEDDVIDIRDYFTERFGRQLADLADDYWPEAVKLAPYLQPAARIQLFSVLWQDVPEFTDVYRILKDQLDRLGHAGEVRVPREALVREIGPGRLERHEKSILNVQTLTDFGADQGETLDVLTLRDGAFGEGISVPRSILAALTREIVVTMASPPQAELLEQVDLLDFPGYRTRGGVASLDDLRGQQDALANPVAELILRGKVAYLFERYTADQQMNVLLFCQPSGVPQEVRDIVEALERWVLETQGGSADDRAGAKPSLLWLFTKFDNVVTKALGAPESALAETWKNLMVAQQEKLTSSVWLQEWAPGKRFTNIFLMRRPRMLETASYIVTKNQQREEFVADARIMQRLELLKRSFVESPLVRERIAEPERTWDSMLGLDDGGGSRVIAYLREVAHVERKLSWIDKQVSKLASELWDAELKEYFTGDTDVEQVNRKMELAQQIGSALKARVREDNGSFSELLLVLQPERDRLRTRYLHASAQTAGPGPRASGGGGSLFNLEDLESGAGGPQVARGAALFAEEVMSLWTERLRGVPGNKEMQEFLGLTEDVLRKLVGELIIGADRLRLQERLAASLDRAEVRSGAKRSELVDQQTLQAATLIAQYIDYLGFVDMPLDARPTWKAGAGERYAFTPPPVIPYGAFPVLGPSELPYSAFFIFDWLAALEKLAVENAGHTAGREFSADHTAQLARIRDTIVAAGSNMPHLGAAGP